MDVRRLARRYGDPLLAGVLSAIISLELVRWVDQTSGRRSGWDCWPPCRWRCDVAAR